MKYIAVFLFTLLVGLQNAAACGLEVVNFSEFKNFGIEATYEIRDRSKDIKGLQLRLPAETKYGGLLYASVSYRSKSEIIVDVPMYTNEHNIPQPVSKVLDIAIKKSEVGNVTFTAVYGCNALELRGFNEL